MKDKIERFEEDIEILKSDLKICKKKIIDYKKEIKLLNEHIKNQYDKYVFSLELGRQRVNESNNRLNNFDQLFKKLSRDMNYLNQTTDLVTFSEESKIVMDTKMQVVDVFSPIDNDEDQEEYTIFRKF